MSLPILFNSISFLFDNRLAPWGPLNIIKLCNTRGTKEKWNKNKMLMMMKMRMVQGMSWLIMWMWKENWNVGPLLQFSQSLAEKVTRLELSFLINFDNCSIMGWSENKRWNLSRFWWNLRNFDFSLFRQKKLFCSPFSTKLKETKENRKKWKIHFMKSPESWSLSFE